MNKLHATFTYLRKIKFNRFEITEEKNYVTEEDVACVLTKPNVPKFGHFIGAFCFFENELTECSNSLS